MNIGDIISMIIEVFVMSLQFLIENPLLTIPSIYIIIEIKNMIKGKEMLSRRIGKKLREVINDTKDQMKKKVEEIRSR